MSNFFERLDDDQNDPKKGASQLLIKEKMGDELLNS